MGRVRAAVFAGVVAVAPAGCDTVTGPGDAHLSLEVVDTRMSAWPLQPGEAISGSTGWRDAGTYQLRIEAADRQGEESVWISSAAFRVVARREP